MWSGMCDGMWNGRGVTSGTMVLLQESTLHAGYICWLHLLQESAAPLRIIREAVEAKDGAEVRLACAHPTPWHARV